MKTLPPICTLLILVTLHVRAADNAAQPEPGPEDGGLRMRLEVAPRTDTVKEGYDVRVDLLNTSERSITLRAGWTRDDAGDVKDYIDAATSIECFPAVLRWMGGVPEGRRQTPQPEEVLKPGAVLSVRWQTEGWHLKNRVTNANEVQNPEFPFPGLYSVHGTLHIVANERTVALRSNEQLVPVGGSRGLPKSTLGQLLQVDAEGKTALLGLGALQKIEPGDQFEHNSKGGSWKLTITKVEPSYSVGTLEWKSEARLTPPVRGSQVTLVKKN